MTPQYSCTNLVQEHHEEPIYCVTFNTYDSANYDLVASAGGRQATVYKCKPGGDLTVFRTYVDDHPRVNLQQVEEYEAWYVCKWSINVETGDPLLLLAGRLAIIRVININTNKTLQTLKGHGKEVNDLAVHPKHPHIVVSGSKDNSIRLWNIASGCCVLLMKGSGGHLGDVFTLDFHLWDADLFVSGGMDEAVKIWSLKGYWDHIAESSSWSAESSERNFTVKIMTHPIFSSTRIHHDYIDCVRFLGDLVLSKSTDFKIHLWRPVYSPNPLLETSSTFELLRVLSFSGNTQYWFRFSLSVLGDVLALGNNRGELVVFNPHNPEKHQQGLILKHKRMGDDSRSQMIRQAAVSHDGNTIIASTESGCLWRWDRRKHTKWQQQQQQQQQQAGTMQQHGGEPQQQQQRRRKRTLERPSESSLPPTQMIQQQQSGVQQQRHSGHLHQQHQQQQSVDREQQQQSADT